MNFIVGLTGGIGSGKSTVAELFVHHGAALVDTDAIAHALTAAGGAAMAAIVAAFGDGVVDASGALDRAAMRSLVFSDQSTKSRLEAILHPLIRQQSEALCNAMVTAPYVLLVVPGTRLTATSIAFASRSSSFRSLPKTLMPPA